MRGLILRLLLLNVMTLALGCSQSAISLPAPPSITGLVLFASSDFTDAKNDGDSVSLISDLSGNGNTLAVVNAKPTLSKTRWNSQGSSSKSTVVFPGNAIMRSLGASLVSAFSGVNASYTVIVCHAPVSSTSGIIFSVENSAHSQQAWHDYPSSKPRMVVSAASGSGGSLFTMAPRIDTIVKSGTSVDFYRNGQADSSNPVTIASATNFAVAMFSVGGINTTPSYNGLIKFILVYNKALSSIEQSIVETWLASQCGLDWVQGLGGNAPFSGRNLIQPVFSQSNGTAQGQTTYAINDSRIRASYWDQFNRLAVEPISSGVNAVPAHAYTGSCDQWGQYCIELFSLAQSSGTLVMPTDQITIVSCGVDGTSSAQWVNGNITDPPDINTLFGNAKLRTAAAMQAQNAIMMPPWVYQGENDAAAGTSGATWKANWLSNEAAWYAWTAAMGFPLLRPAIQNFFYTVLPPTVPSTSTAGAWNDIRASQQTMTYNEQAPNGPFSSVGGTNLHLTTGALQADGVAKAIFVSPL